MACYCGNCESHSHAALRRDLAPDPRYCWMQGVWVADCDPCDCAARDRAEDQAEDRAEHLRRDEGER